MVSITLNSVTKDFVETREVFRVDFTVRDGRYQADTSVLVPRNGGAQADLISEALQALRHLSLSFGEAIAAPTG